MSSLLVFDAIHEVLVPDGLSEQGREEITDILKRYRITVPEGWDWRWTTKAGNMTKRLEKEAKTQNRRLPTSTIQLIGETAQTHSLDPKTYYLRFTHNLNWNDGDFGDAGSCFWGGRVSHRKLLISSNAYAVQFFRKAEDDEFAGIGRCFGYELEDNVHVLFNAYGKLQPEEEGDTQGRKDASVVRIANIVALHMGIGSYKKVDLTNTEDQLFINSNAGYVIGPRRLIRNIARIDLGMEIPDSLRCAVCGRKIFVGSPDNPDLQAMTVPGEAEPSMCVGCWRRAYFSCDQCGEGASINEVAHLGGRNVCRKCLNTKGRVCVNCGAADYIFRMFFRKSDKRWYCRDCFYRYTATCIKCLSLVSSSSIDSDGVCDICAAGTRVTKDALLESDGRTVKIGTVRIPLEELKALAARMTQE